MKRSTWMRKREQLFAGEAAFAQPGGATASVDLVGRDFASQPARSRRAQGWLVPVMIGAVAAALLLGRLRVEILRQRYAVMDAVAEESQLQQQQRALTVKVRRLRDPSRLAALAASSGFARPERVVTLTVPLETRP